MSPDNLIKRSPVDEPVYTFMDKKQAQGKPYYVYMTAVANKFLRIYYGRVKEYLSALPENEEISYHSQFHSRPAHCGGLVFVSFIQPV